MKATLYIGDAGDTLDELPDQSVDSIVTDPPAGIGFQGHQWDKDKGGRTHWIQWLTAILKKAHRIVKPGGHCLLWALPRTSHWTATALEDAGFEIRDIVTHLQAQGYPKSITLSTGVGSALKPASEHWILARRPPEGTLKANFERHRVGGLNIDEARVESTNPPKTFFARGDNGTTPTAMKLKGARLFQPSPMGRWPPNVAISHSPDCVPVQCVEWCTVNTFDPVSRFFPAFFTPKPTRSEREEGCDELPAKSSPELTHRKEGSPGLTNPRAGTNRTADRIKNYHPTVKSIALMTWLVKLVTPQRGTVLDPFTGSGSTGVAAVSSGRSFIGIEREEGFALIAQARVNFALSKAGR